MQHTLDPTVRAHGLDERLAALRPGLDLFGLPACVLDTDLRYRYVNAAYAAHTGCAAGEFTGRTAAQVFTIQPQDDRREQLLRALSGESVVFYRQALQGPNAGQWLRAHYMPIHDDGGRVLGVLAMLVDVQELKDAERQLAERERQVSLIMDAVGLPITYIDRSGVIRFANRPSVEWSGRTSETMIGWRMQDVAPPEVLAAVKPLYDRAFAGETVTYEREALWPGREKRRIRGHLIPDRDAAGEVRGLLSVLIDIDEDHRLREALQTKEAQLRSFAENIPGPIAVVNADFRYLFANKHFQRIRGLRLEEIVGKRVRDVLGAEAAELYFEPFVELLMAGETCTYERLEGPPGGEARWHLVRLAPILGGDGRFNGYYTVGSDIHDMKLAEDRLREREAQLRLYTDNIPDAVAYLDRNRIIRFVNKHFAEQRGIPAEEMIGRTTAAALGPDVAGWIARRTQRVLDRGEVATYERLVTLPGGEQHWFHVKAVPHFDESGSGFVRGMYVVAHDIHEVKKVQEQLAAREEELRFFAENIPEAICYIDLERGCTFINNVFLETRGIARDEALGKFPRDVYSPDVMAELGPHLERVLLGEERIYERIVATPAGAGRWQRIRLTPRRDAKGVVRGYYVVSTDIHEQKTVEEELRRTNSILSAHFDNTPLAVIEWNTDLRIVRWSGQAEAIFGWHAFEALGRPLTGWRLVYEEDESAVGEMVQRLVEGTERHATLLHRNYRRDGSVIWVEWHNSALRDASGKVISILSLAQDVSSRIQAEERLQYMATHDGLTGLPNSVLLNDRLDAALSRARRARRRVGVMFLDLDHFKDVNDTLGHRVGDGLLKELALRIRAALRQSDVLARISGDEFVVVLEDLDDEEAPERVARKILEEVRRPFHIEGHEIHVSGSLGLALHPEDGTDAETLLKNADAAMYHAKELGRNSFRMFSAELAARRTEKLQIETALRRALRDAELSLHYQPIVDIATGEVNRAEALLRWHDPERGLTLPGAFIPLADETGLGNALGHWVLETACRQARAWRDAGLGDIVLCVNLSAAQLRDTAMVVDLKHILERTGCEARWLQFEITETSMVRDVEGASLVLSKLRMLGVRIAIDDFGTGFSSLSHLRHLPVDVLKIDKSFVADIDAKRPKGDSSGGAAIVSAVIGLARGLGLDVVAEGVERKMQLDFLRSAGCRSCQGYLLCQPLPAEEFEKWLKKRKVGGRRLEAGGKPKKANSRSVTRTKP
jgi:diguanylate cyclase (GGDEF)-like protein/PAS domain S-box-containing protein